MDGAVSSPPAAVKKEMASLLDCSHELLHNIIVQVDPANLATLSLTCRSLRAFIQGNTLLCKEIYLRRWDYPATKAQPKWEADLRSLVKLEKAFASDDIEYKRSNLPLAVSIIPDLVSIPAPEKNIDFLSAAFQSQDNVDAFLARSGLYHHGGTARQIPADTAELRQQAARLHCFYGIPIDHPVRHGPRRTTGAHLQNLDPFLPPASDAHHGRTLRSSQSAGIAPNKIARARVYDLREYTMASRWGPFKKDGSLEVDWEKMEAIMVLLTFNLRLFCRLRSIVPTFYGSWEGVGRDSFQNNAPGLEGSIAGMFSMLRPLSVAALTQPSDPDLRSDEEKAADARQAQLDKQDPYGVTGTWMRIVCFLDYNDLYAFNFTRSREQQENNRGIDTREAIRLIRLKTKVTKIVYPRRDREDDSDSSSDFDDEHTDTPPRRPSSKRPADSQYPSAGSAAAAGDDDTNEYSEWPIVYFSGVSRSLHANWDPNANSAIRGQVRMTRHGDVRWTTWSIFHGEERWRSEGVQVGGPNSARGVLGHWFDKDYERQGPAGPTAFWKISTAMLDDADEDDDGPDGAALNPLWQPLVNEDDLSDDGEEVDVDMDGPDPDEDDDGSRHGDGNDEDGDSDDQGSEDEEAAEMRVADILDRALARPLGGMVWEVSVDGEPDPEFEAELRAAAAQRGFGMEIRYTGEDEGRVTRARDEVHGEEDEGAE